MSVETKFEGYTFYDNEGGFEFAQAANEFLLADHLPDDKKGLDTVVDYTDRHIEAVWILGRLIEELDVDPVPEEERSPGTMMEFSFNAEPEEEKTILFGCNDAAGSARLVFGPEVPQDTAAEIAAAFFGLLLAKPNQLSDFRAGMENVDSGISSLYGVEKGKLFYKEEEPGSSKGSADDFDIGGLSGGGWGDDDDDDFGHPDDEADDDEDDDDDW